MKAHRLRCALAILLGAGPAACGGGGSNSPTTTDPGTTTPTADAAGTTPDALPTGNVSNAAGSCAHNDITIAFSPMYTAVDGIHTFQVPAIVTGIAATAITWSASDPTMVGMQTDSTTGGVMITALKAGSVDIIATAGTVCGVSKLTISQAVSDDWTAGDMRYNNGVVLVRPSRMGRDGGVGDGGMAPPPSDAGRGDGGPGGGSTIGVVADGGDVTRVACTNCHGPTANGPYKTVSHTPEQIGGFSDEQLTGIFNGIWPTGSGNPFDTSITSQRSWESFHKWDMTADEAAGVIIYLRALTPAPQTGSRNFGGRGPGGDGGAARPPQDSGVSVD
jgi:hypothetical protein